MYKPKLNATSKYNQGEFIPKNPKKYVGTLPILSRSSWELKLMQFFDTHPNVICWGSENVAIPYMHPFKKRIARYYPDFMVKYRDKNGKEFSEVIEVKPQKEAVMEKAKSKYDKLSVILNQHKWAAAKKFCEANNLTFRIITEADLFKLG